MIKTLFLSKRKLLRNQNMKIGIVLYPTYGGSGVVATELGKSLAARGHEIHFITYSQPVRLGSFRENLFYHEVSVSNYPLFEYEPYETVLASEMVDVVKLMQLMYYMCIMQFHTPLQLLWRVKY